MADLDVVVVGAGFAGIYAVHALRSSGLSVRAFEAGGGIGGTWFWNSYPGARCDVESKDYSFSFSPELEQEWSWSERYPAQPEILRYLSHVADRFGLWPHIQLNTRVTAAVWNSDAAEWAVTTEDGAVVTARFFVSAVGCLSAYQMPSLPGLETFSGSWYHTARWPAEGVDFAGQRVGLIGTGSTGIQVAPEIAAVASELYVFQRTPNYAVPNRNRPWEPEAEREFKSRYREYRKEARESFLGVPITGTGRPVLDEPPEDVQRTFTERWRAGGGMPFLGAYTDLLVDQAANDVIAEFMRERIRETVDDPAVAELLCPRTFPVGSKRLCQSDDYYAMYNRPNVTLVDLRSTPLTSASEGGLSTTSAFYGLDAIVFATGFDAISGALRQIDVRGASGVALADRWAAGPRAYLGIASPGVPEHVHRDRSGVAVGAQQHGAFDRAARGVDQGLHRLPVRARVRDGGGSGRGRGRVDGARDRGGVLDAVPEGGLVVHRGEHPGQAPGVHDLRRRRRTVRRRSAMRWPRRAIRGLRSAPLDLFLDSP